MRRTKTARPTHTGLIADTMELPAVTGIPPKAPPPPPTRGRPSLFVVLFVIVGSFALGFAVRVAFNAPNVIRKVGVMPPQPQAQPPIEPATSPKPLGAGADVLLELGRKIEVPMFVQQVLPFMPRGGTPKYRVLGGYLIDYGGKPDKTRPVMAVFANEDLDSGIQSGTLALVSGLVVMVNEAEQTASSLLSSEQERDLIYIAERVNHWDRVTLLGTFAKISTE